jgi:LPXTG-motif cell wall-anchored protein
MGVGESGDPGLWTFPDHAGQQADPPGILEDAGPTPITATPTENGSTGETTGTPSQTPATGTTVPGFGVGAGALGLGLGAWWLRRRSR